jgi:MucB/RseB N-terminal domain
VGVAAGQTRRRWLLVAVGLAITCALPAVASALPVAAPRSANPVELRTRMLASANLPYSGYVESDGALGVPNLGKLSDITAMLDGSTRMRVWQASASSWRADVLSDAGERDTYQLRGKTYTWDSGGELLTEVTGDQPVRPPRAPDLLPPALALRLLHDTRGTARITSLPAERIAGRDAGGLRLVPTDPATTIGQIDIWADSANGLPLQVEITGRGSGQVVLASRFLQVAFNRPSGQVLTPAHGPGTGFTAASPGDIASAAGDLDDEQLPGSLAGQSRVPQPPAFQEIGIYGRGLSTFAVITLRGHSGRRDLRSAERNGGTPLTLAKGFGVQIATPLITVVLAHPCDSYDTFLIAGLVSPQLLAKAAAQLTAKPDRDL